MYSDHFKNKFLEQENEDESRSTSKEKRMNPYLKEIERKKAWKEKIEQNKDLPLKFLKQAKNLNLKRKNPELWQEKQQKRARLIEEERSEVENSKHMDFEESLIKKDIGNEYLHESKMNREYLESLEYQVKKESKNIREYGQVNSLKMKVGQLDQNAKNIYKRAKFAGTAKEKIDGNVAGDSLVIQSMFNKLSLIENIETAKPVKIKTKDYLRRKRSKKSIISEKKNVEKMDQNVQKIDDQVGNDI